MKLGFCWLIVQIFITQLDTAVVQSADGVSIGVESKLPSLNLSTSGFPSGQRDCLIFPSYASFVKYKDGCNPQAQDCSSSTAVYKIRFNIVAFKYTDDMDRFFNTDLLDRKDNETDSDADGYLPPYQKDLQFDNFKYFFSSPLIDETLTLDFSTYGQQVKFVNFTIIEYSGKLQHSTGNIITVKTDSDGFYQTVAEVEFTGIAPGSVLNFTGQMADVEAKTSQVFVAGETGLTLVTDVDETLKKFGGKPNQVFGSLFYRKYEPIEGMIPIVKNWVDQAQPQSGDKFSPPLTYYLSAGAWPMAPSVLKFVKEMGLPPGPVEINKFDMSQFRMYSIKNILRFLNSQQMKKDALRQRIMFDMPKRAFVLLGDNVMKDPEIYADAMKDQQNGMRVKKSIIRMGPKAVFEWHQRPNSRSRYEKAYRDFDKSRWLTFNEPAQLESINTREIMLQDDQVLTGRVNVTLAN